MKNLTRLGLLASLVLSQSAFAVNPVEGIYGGINGDVMHGTNPNFNVVVAGTTIPGSLKYSQVGGGGGAQLGYRIRNYRIEGQATYTFLPYDSFTFGGCTINKNGTSGCPALFSSLMLKGDTSTLYGMVNFYYDAVTFGADTNFVPYIGLGIGASRLKNTTKLMTPTLGTILNVSTKSSSAAAQVIVGASYYLDDFTWAGVDYRYFSSNNVDVFGDKRFSLSMINFSLNGSFDKG